MQEEEIMKIFLLEVFLGESDSREYTEIDPLEETSSFKKPRWKFLFFF